MCLGLKAKVKRNTGQLLLSVSLFADDLDAVTELMPTGMENTTQSFGTGQCVYRIFVCVCV